MRMARKLGVITYRSALEWDGRFGRVRLDSDRRDDDDPFGLEFEVESYLEGHARRFVRRFDPNCYLYLSRSMDWFDLGEGCAGTTAQGLAGIRGLERALAIGVQHRHPVPAAAAGRDCRWPARQRQRGHVPPPALAAGP
jgi:homoserine O-acetyltransferase